MATSDLMKRSFLPPVTLSLPPTIEARALNIFQGKGASLVQASTPGMRENTVEEGLFPCPPPTTIKAYDAGVLKSFFSSDKRGGISEGLKTV